MVELKKSNGRRVSLSPAVSEFGEACAQPGGRKLKEGLDGYI
jgi:hypothetical protein